MQRRLALIALAVALLAPSAASAADLSVFCAGAVRSTVTNLTAAYERASGNHVTFTYGTVGQLREALAAGKKADVILVSSAGLDALAASGATVPASRVDLGKTGVGVAVRAGAPLPDVSTPDALKATLLGAPRVVYPDPAQGATSGKVIEAVFAQLGIADAMAPKVTKTPGGFSAQLVADGKADVALQNVTELLAVKGVTLAGPFPAALQTYTTYGAAVTTNAASPDLAKAYIAALASTANAATWRRDGFEIPAAR